MSTEVTTTNRHGGAETPGVSCPICGGDAFRTVYRVLAVHSVTLSRDERGEILISRPGACIEPPRNPEPRDFHELQCAGCGARLDWELDHRSLYVVEQGAH